MEVTTTFIPMLTIPNGVTDIDFYIRGLGAVELKRWSNDDGSVHVAELSINSAMFHLQEEKPSKGTFSPFNVEGSTVTIGLAVEDPDALAEQAVAAGAKLVSAMQDYDYGYRQGEIKDPFGHHWLLQKQIDHHLQGVEVY